MLAQKNSKSILNSNVTRGRKKFQTVRQKHRKKEMIKEKARNRRTNV